MKKTEAGMYWHVHHDTLLEYCYDYNERRTFIERNKPANEQKLRLRLFAPVSGELPKAYHEAWKAHAEARKAYAEAWKAFDEVLKACDDEIQALHKIECPDCPWDGNTIFPKG